MLGLIGLNFKSAPVNLREQFSFTDEENIAFTMQIRSDGNVRGSVILSTCNRSEIYFDLEKSNVNNGYQYILDHLATFKNYTPELKENFYFLHGEEVVTHLFKVVSGLDSMVIGEDQIIGQVKSAFMLANDNKFTGNIIGRMFQKSFETGKRVRTETAINNGYASISSASIDLCEKKVGNLADVTAIFIGSGQTGELAIQAWIKKGGKKLFITNRTYEKANELAVKYNAYAVPFENKELYLEQSDIIFIATASTSILIDKEMVEKIQAKRNHQKQIYVDLSVPRNIAQDVGDVQNVKLFDVDHLQEIVRNTTEKRKEAIDDAMIIIEELSLEFMEWVSSLSLSPTIRKIRQQFEQISKKEMEIFAKLNDVSDVDALNSYTAQMTEKYTQLFIKNLKNVTENGKRNELINMVDDLFELA